MITPKTILAQLSESVKLDMDRARLLTSWKARSIAVAKTRKTESRMVFAPP
jgi:hypothetical protein